jgi:hypothetical protein
LTGDLLALGAFFGGVNLIAGVGAQPSSISVPAVSIEGIHRPTLLKTLSGKVGDHALAAGIASCLAALVHLGITGH